MFLSWGSVRYVSGFQKLSGFYSVEHDILSFMFSLCNLRFVVIMAIKMTVFVILYCIYLMRFCAV